MPLERIGAILGIVAVTASVCVTFGIEMAKLEQVAKDVERLRVQQEEVRRQQEEILKAIGVMEHERWKRERRKR